MSSRIKDKNIIANSTSLENKKVEVASGGVVFYISPKTGKCKFLLLKHKGKMKLWDLPKGHLKKNETLEKAAYREVLEETGIPIEQLKLLKNLEHQNIYVKNSRFGKKKEKIVYLFLFQALTKDVKLSNEHSDFKWAKFEKLEEKITFPEIAFPAFVEANEYIQSNPKLL